MNKQELASAVAAKTGFSKRDSRAAVDAVFDALQEAVVRGEKVQITGFGTFFARIRGARQGRNPATGASVAVKEHRIPGFRPGGEFRQALKK